MIEERWKCKQCGEELTVTRLNEETWQSLRCRTSHVGGFRFGKGAWWHKHEKQYSACGRMK